MAKWEGLVPFDGDGNLVYNAPDPGPRRMALLPGGIPSMPGKLVQVYFWPNSIFQAELRFKRFVRGNSSVRALFGVIIIKEPDYEVSMFLSDLERAITLFGWQGQSIHGVWTYRKKGRHYGICPKE